MFHDQRLADAVLGLPVTEEAIDRQLKNRFAAARLMWAPRGFDPHLEKWLHRIRIPSLVLWGAQDRCCPPGPQPNAGRAAAARDGARDRVLRPCAAGGARGGLLRHPRILHGREQAR